MMRRLIRVARGERARAPHKIALLTAAIAFGSLGCLPGDTRPVPERVYVTAEPSTGISQGFETIDGWRVTFDRFLITLGSLDFESNDSTCNSYAEAHYERIFDFAVAGREKVGNLYGLGTCRLDFRIRAPALDVIIGAGASEADVTRMRTPGSDRFVENRRASVMAIGSGRRGAETKQFEWVFRQYYEIKNCETLSGTLATTVKLTENASSELRIEVRGEELFRAYPDDTEEYVFQPIADADANADGVVTLDELVDAFPALGPIGDGGIGGGGAGGAGGLGGLEGAGGANSGDAGAGAQLSIGALIYTANLPRVLRIAGGGPCEPEERMR